MVPQDKLAQITQRFEYLEARLNAGAAPAEDSAYVAVRDTFATVAGGLGGSHGLGLGSSVAGSSHLARPKRDWKVTRCCGCLH